MLRILFILGAITALINPSFAKDKDKNKPWKPSKPYNPKPYNPKPSHNPKPYNPHPTSEAGMIASLAAIASVVYLRRKNS